MSDQEHLDLVNAVIAKRLRGDAYTSYTAQQQVFTGESLSALYEIRERLQRSVNASGGGSFHLAVPLPD